MKLTILALSSFLVAQQIQPACEIQSPPQQQSSVDSQGVTVTRALVPIPGSTLKGGNRILGPGQWFENDPVSVALVSSSLWPQHYRILQDTGWDNYVTGNADSLSYRDAENLGTKDGQSIMGQARFQNGRRFIEIAIGGGHSDAIVVSAIVHEAGHHERVLLTHQIQSEAYAKQIQQRFLDDHARVYGTERIDIAKRFPQVGGER